MYIEQAYKGLTDIWRYIVGCITIFLAWQFLGSMPLIGVALMKMDDFENFPTEISGMVDVLGSNLFLFLMLLTFAIGLVAIFLCVKYLHNLSLKEFTTTRERIDWKRFWFIFLLWGGITSGLVLIDYYYINPDSYVWNFKLKPFLTLLVLCIFLLPLQTSFEEYAFRGYGMQLLGTTLKNRWLPLVITSVAFGLLHIFNPEVEELGYVIMIYYIGTGLFLGIISLMDDGLELALGFHFANNLFTALLVTADWTALQTDSILKDISDPGEMVISEIIVPVFIIFPILLFILSKKYKWTNWKDKLLGPVIEPPKESYKIIEE